MGTTFANPGMDDFSSSEGKSRFGRKFPGMGRFKDKKRKKPFASADVESFSSKEDSEKKTKSFEMGGSNIPSSEKAYRITSVNMPEIRKGVDKISSFLPEHLSGVGRNINKIAKALGVSGADGSSKGLFSGKSPLGKLFGLITSPFKTVSKMLTKGLSSVTDILTNTINTITGTVGKLVGSLGSVASSLIKITGSLAEGVTKIVGEATKGVVKVATKSLEIVPKLLESTVKATSTLIEGLSKSFSTLLQGTAKALSGITKAASNIVQMAIKTAPMFINAAKMLGQGALALIGGTGKLLFKGLGGLLKGLGLVMPSGLGLSRSVKSSSLLGKLTPVYIVGGYLSGTEGGISSFEMAKKTYGSSGTIKSASSKIKGVFSPFSRKKKKTPFDIPVNLSGIKSEQKASIPGTYEYIKAKSKEQSNKLRDRKVFKNIAANTGRSSKMLSSIGNGFSKLKTLLFSAVPALLGVVKKAASYLAASRMGKGASNIINSVGGRRGKRGGFLRRMSKKRGVLGKVGRLGDAIGSSASGLFKGGKGLSKLGSIGKTGLKLAKGIVPTALLGLGVEYGSDYLASKTENKTAKRALGSVGAAASYGATGALIGSIIPGIGTAIGGAVGAGLGVVTENWDLITKGATNLFEKVKGGITSVIESISNIGTKVKDVFNRVKAKVIDPITESIMKVKDGLLSVVNSVKETIGKVVNPVLDFVKNTITTVSDLFKKGINKIKSYIPGLSSDESGNKEDDSFLGKLLKAGGSALSLGSKIISAPAGIVKAVMGDEDNKNLLDPSNPKDLKASQEMLGFALEGDKNKRPVTSSGLSSLKSAFKYQGSDSISNIEASNKDIDIMARTMWGEARGDHPQGMAAVGSVIMNRVKEAKAKGANASPGSVSLAPWQFSAWNKNDPNRSRMLGVDKSNKQFSEAVNLAEKIVDGEIPDITNGSTFYHTTAISPKWAKGERPIKKIGSHVFYTGIAASPKQLAGKSSLVDEIYNETSKTPTTARMASTETMGMDADVSIASSSSDDIRRIDKATESIQSKKSSKDNRPVDINSGSLEELLMKTNQLLETISSNTADAAVTMKESNTKLASLSNEERSNRKRERVPEIGKKQPNFFTTTSQDSQSNKKGLPTNIKQVLAGV